MPGIAVPARDGAALTALRPHRRGVRWATGSVRPRPDAAGGTREEMR
jgi:hypothetical protein